MRAGFWRGAMFRLLAVVLAWHHLGWPVEPHAYAQGVTDPVVVKARAALNRGQYAEAETL
jgi:hypothetical protein